MDCHKRTVLHYAAQNGSFEVCQWIILEEMMPLDSRDEQSHTPLMYAASCKFGNLFFGTHPFYYPSHVLAIDVFKILLLRKPSMLGHRNITGFTAFHLAVVANNLEAIQFLCKEFENSYHLTIDSSSRTPLHYAATMGRTEAAQILINCGARNDTRDKCGATPTHYAAQTCRETLEVIMGSTTLSVSLFILIQLYKTIINNQLYTNGVSSYNKY